VLVCMCVCVHVFVRVHVSENEGLIINYDQPRKGLGIRCPTLWRERRRDGEKEADGGGCRRERRKSGSEVCLAMLG
jgi:hypothetical protein